MQDKYTVMLVNWLKFTNTDDAGSPIDNNVAVAENIHVVYQTLLKEGANVKITQIDGMGETTTVREESISEEEDENISYRLDIDFAQCDMSVRRFNELIDGWHVRDVY